MSASDRRFNEDFSTEPWWWSAFGRPPRRSIRCRTISARWWSARVMPASPVPCAWPKRTRTWLWQTRARWIGRSAGQVSGGVTVGKSLNGAPIPAYRKAALLRDAAAGFTLLKRCWKGIRSAAITS